MPDQPAAQLHTPAWQNPWPLQPSRHSTLATAGADDGAAAWNTAG